MPALVGGLIMPSDEQKQEVFNAKACRRPIGVLEMLEYVKSLDVDPVHECEMLWIGEEAYNASLPPTWSEHTDQEGRTYFHNSSSGDTSWKHPMDDLFREVVGYYRQVVAIGGFWTVDDELSVLEEQTRQDLSHWTELFDEKRQKFYYNSKTDESRFDDPKVTVYHSNYMRIRMVAKIRERLPLLAAVERPVVVTQAEIDEVEALEDEEIEYIENVIRIQAMFRARKARKRVRELNAVQTISRGYQPLADRVKLKMELVGGRREVMLCETSPHRRRKAAVRLQARIRGVQSRNNFRPLVARYRFVDEKVRKFQAQARIWLARRKAVRDAKARKDAAASTIEEYFRTCSMRCAFRQICEAHRCGTLEKQSGLAIKAACRSRLAQHELESLRLQAHTERTHVIQRAARSFLAKGEIQRCLFLKEPCTFGFLPTSGDCTTSMPWTWRLSIAAMDDRTGSNLGNDGTGHGDLDLFEKTSSTNFEALLMTKIQARFRGQLSRIRRRKNREMVAGFTASFIDGVVDEWARRRTAAIRLQTRARGWLTRRKDLLATKFHQRMVGHCAMLKDLQSFFVRCKNQKELSRCRTELSEEWAAVKIQRLVRGYQARVQFALLSEEACWPLKSWFEYKATGPSSVQINVQFLTNPRFDTWRFFNEHGGKATLYEQIGDMNREVSLVVGKYLTNARLTGEIQQITPEPSEAAASSHPAAPSGGGGSALGSASRSAAGSGTGTGLDAAAADPAAADPAAADPATGGAAATAAGSAGSTSVRGASERSALSGQSLGSLAGTPERAASAAGSAFSSPPQEYGAGSPDAPAATPPGSGKVSEGGDVPAINSFDGSTRSPLLRSSSQSKLPRKHYGGTFKDGRFVRTNAHTIKDLTENERGAVLVDIAEQRRQKVEELARRQAKRQAKHQRAQRREVQQLQESTASIEFLPDAGARSRDMRKLLRQKEREAGPPLSAAARTWQGQAAAFGQERGQEEPPASGGRRQVHRHVHHHMHRHPDATGDQPDTGSPYAPHDLGPPQMPARGWPGTDMRRTASVAEMAPPSRLATPMGQSSSLGQLNASLRCMSTQQMFQAHAERARRGGFRRSPGDAVAHGEVRKNPFDAPPRPSANHSVEVR